MLDRTIVLGTIAACMSATPVAAQAPTPAPTMTAFDGTYAGVSRTAEGDMQHEYATRACVPNGKPGPLTITGGVVRWPGTLPTAGGTAEGSVNAQGVVVMHGPSGMRFDGQIDGRGTVTGRLTSYCGYQLVWQKKGK